MKILVVDDENEIVDLLVLIIQMRGHSVDVAYDGQKALDLLNKNHYDLAFLDHNMPELTGIEIVKYIQQHKLQVRTVIISGYEGMNRFFTQIEGADDYISKPFDTKTIESILEKFER